MQMAPSCVGAKSGLWKLYKVASLALACIANASVPSICIAYLALGRILRLGPFLMLRLMFVCLRCW